MEKTPTIPELIAENRLKNSKFLDAKNRLLKAKELFERATKEKEISDRKLSDALNRIEKR
jgi:hypothetical protein